MDNGEIFLRFGGRLPINYGRLDIGLWRRLVARTLGVREVGGDPRLAVGVGITVCSRQVAVNLWMHPTPTAFRH